MVIAVEAVLVVVVMLVVMVVVHILVVANVVKAKAREKKGHIFCPVPDDGGEYTVMMNTTSIEEIGMQTNCIQEFAKQNRLEYRFNLMAKCRCHGFSDMIKNQLRKPLSYLKLSKLFARKSVFLTTNLVPIL
jgi:hypothetical protein